jgi:hypothetical protein
MLAILTLGTISTAGKIVIVIWLFCVIKVMLKK